MSIIGKIVSLFSSTSQKTGLGSDNNFNISKEMKEGARALASEGIVLLENDGTLPITPSNEVAVFGRTQYNYFCVGYGSGGDVNTPYKISLTEGLRSCDEIRINKRLEEIYINWCKQNVPDEGYWGHWPYCFEEMPLSYTLVQEARKTSDVALIVIGRATGEDREQKLKPDSFYLNKGELDMIDKVTLVFQKVVLILDVGNIIDFEVIASLRNKLSAILLAPLGGMESGNALCDVLSGRVSPSGRLADTIAVSYHSYPSSDNFGNRKYNNYEEDIYVGYRYFESFAKEEVLYPFGYGLSYTDFDIQGKIERIDNAVKISANVKNIGTVKGKEVIQIYVTSPIGKLSKPIIELKGFAKTKLLDIGEEERVEVIIDDYSLSSYDDDGLTDNIACWVLERGDYEFYIGKNSRDITSIGKIFIEEKVTSKCHTACPPKAPLNVLDGRDTILNGDDSAILTYRVKPDHFGYLKGRIFDELPEEIMPTKSGITYSDVKEGRESLDELVAELSNEELDTLCHGHYKMNSPFGAKGNAGAIGGISNSLIARGIPVAIPTDGPSGIRLCEKASLLPSGMAIACSWNEELAEHVYSLIAKEMREKGSDILLAPGMNIHRNHLCGRNFEYYSEDPLLTGKIASAVVKGIQSEGSSACIKHFACNHQERARKINDSRLSERALREIYLKGFEIAIKESDPKCVMASYNKVNGVYSYHNYDLCTVILRQEWGYKHLVITDWWTKKAKNPDFKGVDDNAYRIRAQADVLMPGGNRLGKYDGTTLKSLKKGGLTRAELQRSAKNVLQFLIDIGK